MSIELGQIITQIIAFLVMLVVLKKFCWKPLLNIIEERQQKIKAEFQAIEDKKKEAQGLLDQYQGKLNEIEGEARVKIQEAIKDGRKIADEIQKEAQSQAKSLLDRAQTERDRELALAKSHLKSEVVGIAIAISEKILRKELDEQEQKKLIADFVNEAEFK